MCAEKIRGCGWRKIGGLYLVCDSACFQCVALPIPIVECSKCGNTIRFCRGMTYINLSQWKTRICVPELRCYNDSHDFCANKINKCLLLWVGESHYRDYKDFVAESHSRGISKRIARVPREFVLGLSWVALAHRKVIENYDAAIFSLFLPRRIEYVCTAEMLTEKLKSKLEKKFITPVVVPDSEIHQNKVYRGGLL